MTSRTNLTIGIVSSLVTICVLEAVAAVVLFLNPHSSVTPLYNLEPDDTFGWRNPANQNWNAQYRTRNGREVYNAHYETDYLGRRKVACPDAAYGQPHIQNLILIGDSLIFSTGLNDKESLQCQLQHQLHDTEIFNYAVPGHGPNQTLRLLETKDLAREVPAAKKSIVIYTFMAHHIFRAALSSQNYRGLSAPYYALEGDSLHLYKNYWSAHPSRAALYWVTGQSSLLTLLGVSIPTKPTLGDVHLVSAIIAQMKVAATNRLGDDTTFYTVLHPGYRNGLEDQINALRGELHRANINLIEYSCANGDCTSLQIPIDTHPNSAGAALLTRSISAVVRKSTIP